MTLRSLEDVNVSVGHWPFRRTAGQTVATVTRRLKQAGVVRAWVGSLEGLFDRDLDGVNRRLAEACREEPDFCLPWGSVDPSLPDWREDLRRCAEVYQFRGIRLYPGFRGFDCGSRELAECLQEATARHLVVQLVGSMEDERTQNPVFRVPALDLEPLPGMVAQLQGLRLVLLNVFRKLPPSLAERLSATGKIWVDVATLEGVDGLAAAVKTWGPRRLLFGSHFPLFVPESAQLKLEESELPEEFLSQIARGNAEELLTIR